MLDSRRWIVLTLAACVACSENTAPPPTPASLRVLSSRSLEDTIGASFADPLTIEVTDAQTTPVPGDSVRIAVSGVGGGVPVIFGPTPDTTRESTYQATTDSRGMVRAYMRLNTWAGTFHVVAKSGNLRDSISITIRPGAPVRLDLSPRDTAVYVGASYSLTVQPWDRANNPTPAPVMLRTARPQVASADSNDVIQVHATGRAYVVATSGSVTDSVAVSVVPQGRVLALSDALGTFVLTALDGSSYQRFPMNGSGRGRGMPFFFPDGQRIVYNEECRLDAICLFTMDLQGTVDTIVRSTDSLPHARIPQPSRDGAWIYFTAVTGYEQSEIWRATTTGANPTRLGPVTTQGNEYASPSPSPDGSSLAVMWNGGSMEQKEYLTIMSVSTGQAQVIADAAVAVTVPRWSPVGDEIAFWADSGLAIDRSDGQRLLGPITRPPRGGWDNIGGQVDWSSDGKWLVACMTGGVSGDRELVVIERATGEMLPLAFTARDRLCGATWQP